MRIDMQTPTTRPDARTEAYRRQRDENRQIHESDGIARAAFDAFFANRSEQELEALKAEVLPTLDPKVREMAKDRPRFLQRLIWAHVQRTTAGKR
jgi:hypothetical protein